MRFASLGSGSRGNATLIEAGGTRVLLDCGFSVKELVRRLEMLGVEAGSLDAVLVTHEHGDHLRGVGALARRYRLPVWMTDGTFRQGRLGELPERRRFSSHQPPFAIGDLEVSPFPIPHDAREPAQFVFGHAGQRLGILTDAGAVTPHVAETLQACDALMLECNHDVEMLANGPYPPALQARVGGRLGHLSNHQAAALLGQLEQGRLHHLVAAHLSEKNNTPEHVRAALLAAAPTLEKRLTVCLQDEVSGWFELA
jgi:phosphoribosyl 1,2-cyclic phosphodiesterase